MVNYNTGIYGYYNTNYPKFFAFLQKIFFAGMTTITPITLKNEAEMTAKTPITIEFYEITPFTPKSDSPLPPVE